MREFVYFLHIMLKHTLFKIHSFVGLIAGLILSIIGLTGAIYSYDQEILKWFNQDSYTVQPESKAKLSPAQLYQKFPQYQINSITIFSNVTASSIINIQKTGKKKGFNLMVNPYNANRLPDVKGEDFFTYILQLHRYLTLGDFGKQITGICAFITIFFALSGLYLRLRKQQKIQDWLVLKPKLKGIRFIRHLHAILGTWVAIFYLTFALTGLSWSYEWWKTGLYRIFNVEAPNVIKNKDIPRPSTEIFSLYTTTWSIFLQKYPQYSSVTFNTPQKMASNFQINFVDPIPQHERAKNTININATTQQVESIQLYKDIPLNKKIMTSLLAVHRGSFFGSLWHFFAMLSALSMPIFFITGIMSYLKRRKQRPHSNNPDVAPWVVVYASQTGNAERLAWQTTQQLQSAKLNVKTIPLHKLSTIDLKNTQLLFIVSTYATGEAPDHAQGFNFPVLNLSTIHYAILALGSLEFKETFCAYGHHLNQQLQQYGAKQLFPLIEVNNQDFHDIQKWYTQLEKITHHSFKMKRTTVKFHTWKLHHRICLNPQSSKNFVYQIQLKSMTNVTWQAGDIAQVQPHNDKQAILEFLEKNNIEITEEQIDFLKTKNLKLKTLPQLPIREYSIASIPRQGYLELVIRQHYGIGSNWLCQIAQQDDDIELQIRSNQAFHLINKNCPIIFIGAGTGISSLLAHLHQRQELGYYENWLIFGERHPKHDFLYQNLIFNWQKQGVLQHVDCAFSQNQLSEYVQDKLYQNQTRLKEWISNGSAIYVCGNATKMAKNVNLALEEILGTELVKNLQTSNRYRRDIY